MDRIRYIVCYDISQPRRLRRVAKVMQGYGTRLQLSVFECLLDKMRFAELKSVLHGVINHEEDQVLFVSLGFRASNDNVVIEALGRPYTERTRVTIV